MKIVQKFQGGSQIYRQMYQQPRIFAGHPEVQWPMGGEPEETYYKLENLFEGAKPYDKKVDSTGEWDRRTLEDGVGIDRRVVYGQPNDTIYTKRFYGKNPETGWYDAIISRQAGVVHNYNYDGSNWDPSHYGDPSMARPKIVGGVPFYLKRINNKWLTKNDYFTTGAL